MAITEEVQVALEELRASFPDSSLTVEETGDGGAWVRVEPVPTGPAFPQRETWIAFHIPYNYPEADVYPHFIRPDLTRADGQPHGEGFQQPIGCWTGGTIMATQLSRRTNILDSATNTAAGKLLKVLKWLADR
ncbi:hypothetical protein ACFRAU_11115 [Arthrobacter sp. NPDC056691]|uniref:hypothetical protein n=1 Tax=Arthrobacter sp. NPDC056691 TaxID=3345913 RepID=UPI00366D229C